MHFTNYDDAQRGGDFGLAPGSKIGSRRHFAYFANGQSLSSNSAFIAHDIQRYGFPHVRGRARCLMGEPIRRWHYAAMTYTGAGRRMNDDRLDGLPTSLRLISQSAAGCQSAAPFRSFPRPKPARAGRLRRQAPAYAAILPPRRLNGKCRARAAMRHTDDYFQFCACCRKFLPILRVYSASATATSLLITKARRR